LKLQTSLNTPNLDHPAIPPAALAAERAPAGGDRRPGDRLGDEIDGVLAVGLLVVAVQADE